VILRAILMFLLVLNLFQLRRGQVLNLDQKSDSIDLTSACAMVSRDIKDSLGNLLKFIAAISESPETEGCTGIQQCADMEYEVRRINNHLIKLLAIYEADQGIFLLNMDAHAVKDFLDEAMLEHCVIMRQKEIDCAVECDHDLYWYFDRDLMKEVMSNAIDTALRFTNDMIHLTVKVAPNGLSIDIENNGDGFPSYLLEQQNRLINPEPGFINNNTGLGLFFTQTVLNMHQHNGNSGRVSLTNHEKNQGGVFSIVVP
jgi:signal transduction histidine kinase